MRAYWWVALVLGLVAVPATAQQTSESYKFLKAVREHDANALLDSVAASSTVVNTRDRETGETGLHIAVKQRDAQFISYLLSKGANPNLRANSGSTPLVDAATMGFTEGQQILVDRGAAVDMPNSRGETALIRAVQNRDLASVRLLLAKGADPDLRDRAAGRSARDYAAADRRGGVLVKLLADAPAKPAKKAMGPSF